MWGARRDKARPGSKGRIGFLRKWFLLALVLATGCSLPNPGWNRDFVRGLRPAAGDTDRLWHNAHYFRLLGRPQLALKELEEAYRRDPGNLKIANMLARYYDELGMDERAQEIYLEALARDGGSQALNNNLCFSYYLAGNFSQAEACFRQTLSRQPDNEAARNNLGLLLCRLGRQEEARSLWATAAGKAWAARKLDQAMAALAKAAPGQRSEQAAREPVRSPQGPVQAKSEPGQDGTSAAAPVLSGPKGGNTAPPPAMHPKQAANLAQPQPPIPAKAPTAATAAPGAAVASPASARMPQQAREDLPARGAGGQKLRQALVTARELLETRVQVRNGNGIPHMAHEARSLLNLEGFDAVSIANHIDWGMERTVIRYRPGADKVARMLHDKFFANAEMQAAPELKAELDVQVILGHDLSALPQVLAKTPGKAKSL